MKRIVIMIMVMTGLSLSILALAPHAALAAPKDEICQGVAAAGNGGCAGGTGQLDTVIKTGLQIFASIIAIAAVIMLMTAGFKYVTAGGDSGKVGEAKKTIIYAVVGLVIAAFAQSIVMFVLNRATETPEEKKKREAAQKKATMLPRQPYYTIEFNNKTVV